MFDAEGDWSQAPAWSWSPDQSKEIWPWQRKWFTNVSDVKYTKDGKYLLVAASHGGVAKIRTSVPGCKRANCGSLGTSQVDASAVVVVTARVPAEPVRRSVVASMSPSASSLAR